LADRVPANVAAIIMDSPKDELSCLAFSNNFIQNGEKTSRGVISYYSILTLPNAENVTDWLQLIFAQAKSDVEKKVLLPGRQPRLKIIGDTNMILPGKPATKDLGLNTNSVLGNSSNYGASGNIFTTELHNLFYFSHRNKLP
jgi:hypothetical protein